MLSEVYLLWLIEIFNFTSIEWLRYFQLSAHHQPLSGRVYGALRTCTAQLSAKDLRGKIPRRLLGLLFSEISFLKYFFVSSGLNSSFHYLISVALPLSSWHLHTTIGRKLEECGAHLSCYSFLWITVLHGLKQLLTYFAQFKSVWWEG